MRSPRPRGSRLTGEILYLRTDIRGAQRAEENPGGRGRIASALHRQRCAPDMELLFDSKVMLRLWVKVKSGWSDDEGRCAAWAMTMPDRLAHRPAHAMIVAMFRAA